MKTKPSKLQLLWLLLPLALFWFWCGLGHALNWRIEYWWGFPFLATAIITTIAAAIHAVGKFVDIIVP